MTGQTNEPQWYIARDGKQHGPLTDVEMRTFVGHSYLRPSDLLWRPGMADWQPAPQLFPQAFQPVQPAPVAPPQAGGSPLQPQTVQPQTGQPAGAPFGAQPQATGYAAPSQSAQTGGGYMGASHPAAGSQGLGGQGLGAQGLGAQPSGRVDQTAPSDGFSDQTESEDKPKRQLARQAVVALLVIAIVCAGAFVIVKFRAPLMQLVWGPGKAPVAAEAPATAAADATPAAPEQPSLADAEAPAAAAAQIEGSPIDTRLQRVPLWSMLKKEYPDWYVGNVAAAEKLSADKKPQSEVTQQLVQGLVALRRQNATNALAASPEKLKQVASTFLENLRALQSQGVGACFGFISKGELSPGVIEIMQSPESATAMNAQLTAIFEAAAEGAKSPVKHEAAGKADYDTLIAELSKLGWKDEDLQVFSNPRLLAKREPAQVCKMVQDWFAAHLAVQDAAVQERLLYETLKPVVSG